MSMIWDVQEMVQILEIFFNMVGFFSEYGQFKGI